MCQFVNFRKAIKCRGDSTGWVHFPVGCFTESYFLFDVLECGDEFVLSLVVGSLLMVL